MADCPKGGVLWEDRDKPIDGVHPMVAARRFGEPRGPRGGEVRWIMCGCCYAKVEVTIERPYPRARSSRIIKPEGWGTLPRRCEHACPECLAVNLAADALDDHETPAEGQEGEPR